MHKKQGIFCVIQYKKELTMENEKWTMKESLSAIVKIVGFADTIIVHYPLKKELLKTAPFLGGLYKLFPAFGTGDGDLSLSLGNSHLLTAPGTIVITVFLVF